ncbi:putative ankyrin repeat domain-containing protein 29 protein [Eutypa lata UCREL1]|uniref:Putative ankyrin repeat domain-containing protein 29 protein n=1 Tax=Eutypa lata (strain UCR-EL1) TaxID=1287681 RepID=M7T8L8_EUTLA|nr:putative ankyrin repeat domain-containing protein 29 protein [Eutypa lata UCREL1]
MTAFFTYPPARATESLVFSIWLDPCSGVDHILDANFLRNLSGYLDDCIKEGVKPSVLQIILLTENASSLLCPPFLNWMPVWLLFWVHRGLAWYAESVLGYERSYPEYSIEP